MREFVYGVLVEIIRASEIKFKREFACARSGVFCGIERLCRNIDCAKGIGRCRIQQFLREIASVYAVFNRLFCVVKDVLRAVYGKLVFVVEFLVQVRLKVVCFGNEFVEGQREGILDGYAVLLRSFHEAIGCDVEVLNG